MIKIYVYNVSNGEFLYIDTGLPQDVIRDLVDDKDFTLTPPPDYHSPYRWIDTKWVADDTAN